MRSNLDHFEDHFRSGIICGLGIICGAVQFSLPLGSKIYYGQVKVGDLSYLLRACDDNINQDTTCLIDTAAKRLRMRSLRPFPVSSLCCSFSFGVLSNCPGTEFAGMALKSSKRRSIHPRVFPFSKKKT